MWLTIIDSEEGKQLGARAGGRGLVAGGVLSVGSSCLTDSGPEKATPPPSPNGEKSFRLPALTPISVTATTLLCSAHSFLPQTKPASLQAAALVDGGISIHCSGRHGVCCCSFLLKMCALAFGWFLLLLLGVLKLAIEEMIGVLDFPPFFAWLDVPVDASVLVNF